MPLDKKAFVSYAKKLGCNYIDFFVGPVHGGGTRVYDISDLEDLNTALSILPEFGEHFYVRLREHKKGGQQAAKYAELALHSDKPRITTRPKVHNGPGYHSPQEPGYVQEETYDEIEQRIRMQIEREHEAQAEADALQAERNRTKELNDQYEQKLADLDTGSARIWHFIEYGLKQLGMNGQPQPGTTMQGNQVHNVDQAAQVFRNAFGDQGCIDIANKLMEKPQLAQTLINLLPTL